jgi:hypothetical protein
VSHRTCADRNAGRAGPLEDEEAVLGMAMTYGGPDRRDDRACKILPFRRHDAGERAKPVMKDSTRDIDRLIDLSRYEKPRPSADDYQRRMVENVAAVVLLSVLVVIATFDVIGLEQIQRCASAGSC